MATTPNRNNELRSPPNIMQRRREQVRGIQQQQAVPVLAFCDTDTPEEQARVSRIAHIAERFNAINVINVEEDNLAVHLHAMIVGEEAHDNYMAEFNMEN